MFSHPDRTGFLPLAQLPLLVERLMALGYRCLGPAVENGAIVMRELDSPDSLPPRLDLYGVEIGAARPGDAITPAVREAAHILAERIAADMG